MMNDQPNDPVGQRLQREADGLSKPFSESLHGRTMRRVREASMTTKSVESRRAAWWPYVTAGLAAMVALAAWIQRPPQIPPPAVPPHQVAQADLTEVGRWIADASHPVRTSLSESVQTGGMAYLDRDVDAFGHYMIAQLNGMPARQAKER